MTIRLPLAKLSQWQQVTYCCALLERMLPNYQMFSQAMGFGETKVLRNQLDLLWQWLDKSQKVKINYDAQLVKLEEQTPDPEAFDSFGVFPAVDVCMALMSLMQGIQSKESDGLLDVGKLSENSVRYFVELTLVQDADGQEDVVIDEQDILEHPLMEWEIATQNELFYFLKHAPESKATCQEAKQMALEERLSNLGIEIE
ncbi:YjaG family protein [Thalassotalea atypica]|uniref:YjaG family protein n=1 Tax=Thalassotalea atypica TaxID=2054316 RepID=UPI002573FF7B|nr:YjaG family protein [Thalassotalea atypica]